MKTPICILTPPLNWYLAPKSHCLQALFFFKFVGDNFETRANLLIPPQRCSKTTFPEEIELFPQDLIF